MLTRLIPTDGNEGEYAHTSGGLLTIIDIPWLIDASPQFLPLCSQGISLCVYLYLSGKFSLLLQTQKYWIRVHPIDLTLAD